MDEYQRECKDYNKLIGAVLEIAVGFDVSVIDDDDPDCIQIAINLFGIDRRDAVVTKLRNYLALDQIRKSGPAPPQSDPPPEPPQPHRHVLRLV
jgi:hypothetical protein